MGKLGTFGEVATEIHEADTFDYFGEELRVHPLLTDAELVDWLDEASKTDETDPRAGAMVKDFMRAVVHPDDFEQFWALGKQHRQSIEDRLRVANALMEAVVGRPTERRSDSPSGRGTTRGSSPADFALAAQRKLEADGRADLAVAALQHREYAEVKTRSTG